MDKKNYQEVKDIVSQIEQTMGKIDDATFNIAKNMGASQAYIAAQNTDSKEAANTYKDIVDMSVSMAEAEQLRLSGQEAAYEQALQNMNLDMKLTEIAKKRVELQSKINTLGAEAVQDELDALDASEAQIKNYQAQADYNKLIADKKKEMLKPMADMQEKWANTRATITAAWETMKTGPGLMAIMTAGVLAMGAALFQAFMAVEKSVQNIYDTTGLSVGAVKQMRANATELASEYASMGMGIDDALKAQVAFVSEMGSMAGMTKDVVEDLGVMQYQFGLSAEEAAKINRQFMEITDGTADGGKNLMMMVKNSEAVSKYGVDAGQAMKDISNLSGEALAYFSGNAEALAESAVFARKLGVEISTLTSAADKMLNLEQSLTSEMEAEMLIGRNLNLDAMRRAAFEGDMVTLGKEVLKNAGSLEELNSMNVMQQKAMAAAMGMSVEDLRTMVATEERLKNLTADQRAELEAIGAEQENQKEMTFEELKAEKERQVATQKFQNTWKELVAVLQEQFLPALESATEWLADNLDTVITIAKIIGTIFVLYKAINGILALINMKKKVSAFFSKDEAANLAEDVAGGGGADVTKAKGPADGGVTKGMNPSNMLKGAAAMLILAAALWVMAKALQQFNTVEWGSVAKGAVALLLLVGIVFLLGQIVGPILVGSFAMLILAGALWVMGAALLMFNEINWESLGKAAVALLGLAGIAALLGLMVIPIMLGAWAMGILSAALLLFAVATIPLAATGPKTLEFLEGLMTLDGGLLRDAATGIGAIGAALALFGVGSLVAGIGAFFGGDPVKHFKRFAEIGPDLKVASEAITHIAESVNLFGEIKTESAQLSVASAHIMGYAGALMAASGAQTAFAATAAIATPFMAIAGMVSGFLGGEGDEDKEVKVSEMSELRKDIQGLKDAMAGMEINIDGKRAGEIIFTASPGGRLG